MSTQLARAFRMLHGSTRGADSTFFRSESFDGKFGRMFRTLPAARFNQDDLMRLADRMTSDPDTPDEAPDPEENSAITAGYTYLGQFIDHDLTFDPASSLQKQDDPDSLIDFRTPRFDLDCVYGRGPSDQPYLYRDDGLHMLLGEMLTGNPDDPNARQVPRNTPQPGEPARGLLGDPRNDENVIVSQLQSAMLRFHNRMVEFVGVHQTPVFEDIQRLVRWHYQWVVLYDFLPTILNETTYNEILPHVAKKTNAHDDPPNLRFFKPKKGAYMPVEFSVAAYRFGHSMVRPIYRLNPEVRFPIFSTTGESLVGFRKFPSNWAIDWRLFFKMAPAPDSGPTRVQPAYKPDTSLVNPLGTLPPPVAMNPNSLAARNLIRGLRMGLPSGQTVARHIGVTPMPTEQLLVTKATVEDSPGTKPITDVSEAFRDNAPLWFYVLAEAQQAFFNTLPQSNATPLKLGPVGARIVGEVFVGLMLADHHSLLFQEPTWQPFDEFRNPDGKFGIVELLKQAKQA